MSRRRLPHCRQPFIVPVVSDLVADTRSSREIIEEALQGFTAIGRDMIGAATAALVDSAAGHGFDGPEWEANAIRPAIVEIVAPRLHDLLVEVMRPKQHSCVAEAGREFVRHSDAAPRSEKLRAALVDQLFFMVATECEQYGLYPTPGHVERLRECLHDLASGHWSDTPECSVDTEVRSVPPSDRERIANTVIPLLRHRGSECDRE